MSDRPAYTPTVSAPETDLQAGEESSIAGLDCGVLHDPLKLFEQLTAELRTARAAIAAGSHHKFYCVVVPEHGAHTVSEFPDVQGLVGFLRDLIATSKKEPVPPSVRIFYGEQWGISRGVNKRLVSPKGDKVISISSDDHPSDIDPSGSLA